MCGTTEAVNMSNISLHQQAVAQKAFTPACIITEGLHRDAVAHMTYSRIHARLAVTIGMNNWYLCALIEGDPLSFHWPVRG